MCFFGNDEKGKERKDRSVEIDRYLQTERPPEQAVKLLLLGAGESGKSTITKQMKILHLKGFTQVELMEFKPMIHNNIITSIISLADASQNLEIPLQDSTNEDVLNEILSGGKYSSSEAEIDEEMAKNIKKLWNDGGIQKTFARSSEFQLGDSAEYFLNNLDRITGRGYCPTTEDVLKARTKTTGIVETSFTVDNTKYNLVDVGGQRSERRKWMHCFQDVTCVIFCVSLSDYDQSLYEDDSINRMHESLRLFKDVCNTKWFAETSIVIFFNKIDIFKKKLVKTPLTVCFTEYTGNNSYEDTTTYIANEFIKQSSNPRLIYHHLTCATDTNNVDVVFRAVQSTILTNLLNADALLT